ncbi:MAG TPA: MlaD family protein [Stellaceae bacterium]|nr:MlaD family protein [Stellaceae bacterium]
METRAHYVAVGAFVLAMLFLAFLGVLYLGGAQLTARYARYDIYFSGPVTGLSKGAVVEYNGIPVGKVSDIEIDPNNVERIRVTVDIEINVVIKSDAKANVETNILSGVSAVLITKGTQEATALVAKPGERYPVIQSRRSYFASLAARGPELLDELGRIGDHLDQMLNEHNRQAITRILDHTDKFTAELAEHDKDFVAVAQNASTALASVTKLLGDVDASYGGPDGLNQRLRRSLSQINKTASSLEQTSRDIAQVAREARGSVHEINTRTLSDIDGLLRDTRQLVAGLTRLAEQIQRDPSRLLYGDRREGYRPK